MCAGNHNNRTINLFLKKMFYFPHYWQYIRMRTMLSQHSNLYALDIKESIEQELDHVAFK